MNNKNLGIITMIKAEKLEGLPPKQYGRRKSKSSYIQSLNNCLLYDLIRLKMIYSMRKFMDIISNYDLLVHSITSLSLQRVNVTKEPILCTFTTLQNMIQSVRTAFGDSQSTYGGDI